MTESQGQPNRVASNSCNGSQLAPQDWTLQAAKSLAHLLLS